VSDVKTHTLACLNQPGHVTGWRCICQPAVPPDEEITKPCNPAPPPAKEPSDWRFDWEY
jgi:hypothetical protein